MEKSNPRLKALLVHVVDNQLRKNDPPETKLTLQRLTSEGYTEKEAKELIAGVVTAHIYEVLKHERVFNEDKYVRDLNRLPELPWK